MTDTVLRQAVVISFLGHITLFSLFSLSFGPKIPTADFSRISFWGSILRGSDLTDTRSPGSGYKRGGFMGKSEISVLDKINRENSPLTSVEYSKPQVFLAFNEEKMLFAQKTAALPPIQPRREPAIMFYPRLPYHFALYFKDRQTVHIELMFQVSAGDKGSSVLIKRRISSGNLEADLLSMRYISRYLFMQQGGLSPGKWQIVKIDLSTVND